MIVSFPQQKALYCYFVLLIWIIIIIFGYRYFGFSTEDVWRKVPISSGAKYVYRSYNNDYKAQEFTDKYGKLYKSCNALSSISLGTEGKVNSSYTLTGAIILFRHGDRGPLYHIRDMSDINCGADDKHFSSDLYKNFTALLNSYSSSSQSSFPLSFLNAYFHHSVLPNIRSCEIGQLTLLGVQQLLRLGQLLRSIYYERLIGKKPALVGDVFLYSTKYRRTLLSAAAFLYGFFNAEDLHKVSFREVYSFSFCFEECACPMAELLKQSVSVEYANRMKHRSAVSRLIGRMGPIVFTSADSAIKKDLYSLRDALLAYVCHDSKLPCSRSNCFQREHVSKLFSYADWDARKSADSKKLKEFSLLKCYGLIKNIVSHILKIVSEKKSKIVIYSAHDKTIQILLAAFGILNEDVVFPKYASRTIVEIYRNSTSVKKADISLVEQYYFRLVYNGKDQTKNIMFCKDKYQEILHIDKPTDRLSKTYICPIENVVRFLHDDYFGPFNSTNFKDACEHL